MPTKSELESAYRATAYRVFLPGGVHDLRIDQARPEFSAWLADNEVDCWAILTAWNPGSERLSDKDNVARQSALEVRLLELGYEPFAGENVADAGDWPVEDTCFVADMTAEDARAMAAAFGQRAFVAGGRDGVPNLQWMESGTDEQ